MEHGKRFLKIVDDTRARVETTDVTTVYGRLTRGDEFVLVDVREESEWDRGHIPGAVSMGKGVIERDIESRIPDTGADIVLYCGGGFRSVLAADNLTKMGYTRVLSMDGGYRDWLDAGHAVEQE